MAVVQGQSILGLFRTPEEAAGAFDRLRAAGIAPNHIKALTDSPYPDGAFGEELEHHRLYVFPFMGAAIGFTMGLLVTI